MDRILFTISMLQDLKIDGKLISPKYQRPISKDRISVIKDYILANHKNPDFYMPDVLLNKVNDIYHIIDGQHRLNAFIKITGEDRKKMNDFNGIYAVVKNALTSTQEKKLFISINQSVPCPGMYLTNTKERNMLARLRVHINTKYGHQVSSSVRCVSPNINVSTLVDMFSRKNTDGTSFISDWFSDQTITVSNDLCKGIDAFNECVKTLMTGSKGFEIYKIHCPRRSNKHDIERFTKLLNTVVKKAGGETPCYLGFIDPYKIAMCMFAHGKLY